MKKVKFAGGLPINPRRNFPLGKATQKTTGAVPSIWPHSLPAGAIERGKAILKICKLILGEERVADHSRALRTALKLHLLPKEKALALKKRIPLPMLAEAIERETHWENKSRLIFLLTARGEYHPILLKLLRSQEGSTRMEAAKALTLLAPKEALNEAERIIKTTADPKHKFETEALLFELQKKPKN